MSDRITVTGNIATEPEQRRTGSGVPVTTFRLASSQRYRDAQSGEWVDGTTNWYRVSVFRTLGENAFASLRKGQRVIVDGRLRIKDWEANGKRGTEVEIDADALGPDLKWGTAEFRRRASEAAAPAEGSTPSSAQDSWSVPGAPAGAGSASDEASATDAWPVAPTGSAEEALQTPF